MDYIYIKGVTDANGRFEYVPPHQRKMNLTRHNEIMVTNFSYNSSDIMNVKSVLGRKMVCFLGAEEIEVPSSRVRTLHELCGLINKVFYKSDGSSGWSVEKVNGRDFLQPNSNTSKSLIIPISFAFCFGFVNKYHMVNNLVKTISKEANGNKDVLKYAVFEKNGEKYLQVSIDATSVSGNTANDSGNTPIAGIFIPYLLDSIIYENVSPFSPGFIMIECKELNETYIGHQITHTLDQLIINPYDENDLIFEESYNSHWQRLSHEGPFKLHLHFSDTTGQAFGGLRFILNLAVRLNPL